MGNFEENGRGVMVYFSLFSFGIIRKLCHFSLRINMGKLVKRGVEIIGQRKEGIVMMRQGMGCHC